MTIETQAYKGARWLAVFKTVSQFFSWGATIFVARLLVPADYGLMSMATIITGYAMLFSELGLGSAIIQRSNSSPRELSSVFWFAMAVSLFFSLSCLVIAYPTAWLFHEPRIIPLTQAVSGLFFMAGLQIVPMNLLMKELRFKETGRIDAISVVVSCLCMLLSAYLGAGVWTLLIGSFVKAFVSLMLVFLTHTWRPSLQFKFSEALTYLKFGIHLAFGSSVGYVNNQADTFFAGRVWVPAEVGFYSFAKQLSRIPNDKIVSLINQVVFPALSSLKDDQERFNRFYLDIVKVICALVFPLFIGGFLVGDEIVKVLFDAKWYPMIYAFKLMCLAEIITPLTTVSMYVHGAQGRPKWFLTFNLVMVCFMPLSFFLAAPYGLNAMAIPWLTTYVIICAVANYVTLRKIKIPIIFYLRNLSAPIGASLLMACVVWCYGLLIPTLRGLGGGGNFVDLIGKIAIGSGAYLLYFAIFDRQTLYRLKNLRKQ